jgi:protease-4
MRRTVKLAPALLAAALLPAGAAAQVQNAQSRQAGIPAGLAVPAQGVAAAEDPAAMAQTPAAVGFLQLPAVQYFREGSVTLDSRADGLYGATALGPFGLGYSIEWVRPGEPALRRYRKNSLALSLGDHRAWSLGVGWNRFTSPDPSVNQLGTWDAGLTLRPWEHLSLAAAMLGRDGRLEGARVPKRYDLGAATRFWRDAFTLSADLLADDRGRDDFHSTHLAFGAGAELTAGVAVGAQLLLPLRAVPGVSQSPSFSLALTWNEPHAGVTGGTAATPERTGWVAGVRASAERYPAPPVIRRTPVVDVGRELEPDRLPFLDLGEPDPYGLLLRRLDALAKDDAAAAVVVRIGSLGLGGGRIEELRDALLRIRARRPVLAYLTGGSTKEYWLATAANAIATPPGSALEVNGVATSNLYLREGLSRLGVAFEVVAAGKYKSAPEPLVRDAPSPAAREATDAVLDDIFERFVRDVALARRLSPERVRALVDEGLFGAAEAKGAGLVDELLWPDELQAWVSAAAGGRATIDGPYRPVPARTARHWGHRPVVEVVRLEGAIVGGRSRRGFASAAGADTVGAAIRRAAADKRVKAIVLRIESPGGDGFASDLIWREVVQARTRKPVIASMGDLAASGGYLAAAGADVIVAEPSTLTGSIGVFAVKPDLSGLLAKLGVSRTAFARGELSQVESVGKPWNERERRAVERQIEGFYRLFVDRVAQGRKLTVDRVEAVAGGRVWTGRQAVERGLVDRLGSLETAIALAAERAGLAREDVEVRRTSAEADGSLVGATLARATETPLTRTLGAIPEIRALEALSEMGPVLALPVDWVTGR